MTLLATKTIGGPLFHPRPGNRRPPGRLAAPLFLRRRPLRDVLSCVSSLPTVDSGYQLKLDAEPNSTAGGKPIIEKKRQNSAFCITTSCQG
ncbi:hypothetical protein L596_026447 [Steinernema carpocapsae]|uniref:Uncharacterized protein n=1 Tax=Steinernema carpocapsae TaxID=34508 RepID=A0A4U5M1D2_STECR|nr:hypothetical protein L596_026447 [Steinernema carpocapsae]